MTPNRDTQPDGSRVSLFWLSTVMLAIGLYCLAWPQAILEDDYWDRLPDRTAFGYGIGAIFCGGGILFLFETMGNSANLEKMALAGKAIGGLLTVGGFIFVFWTLFDL